MNTAFYPIILAVCFLLNHCILPICTYADGKIYYVDPTNGNNVNPGGPSTPWKTLTHGANKLRAGDTLMLRGGTYNESNIKISCQGRPTQQITIKNYPGEQPIIDGGITEFRNTPNQDWELYDSEKKIFRSKKKYPGAWIVYGYFVVHGKRFRLVPYKNHKDLATINQNFTPNGHTYAGPGVLWNPIDSRIYVRLTASRQAKAMGIGIPEIDAPQLTQMVLFTLGSVMIFEENAAYITIEGLNLRHKKRALTYMPGAHHISVRNTELFGGKTHVFVDRGVFGLVFDNIRIDDHVPPWIAYSDVKNAQKPAEHLKIGGILLKQATHHIRIKNSTFNNLFDGIGITHSSFNVRIHNNVFHGIRDDVIQLGSSAFDIEIDHNKMLFISKGVSWHGSGSPLKPGTKFIHHNIIDSSRAMLAGRSDPDNFLPAKRHGPAGDGMTWYTPFGSHGGKKGFGQGDPWKIYNNTVIFGSDLNKRGGGYIYRFPTFNRQYPHEVYNNIFIQIHDHQFSREARVADGSQILDGNLYFRPVLNPKTPFALWWRSGNQTKNFQTLADFKSSDFFKDSKDYYKSGWEHSGVEADPRLSADYRPDPSGPAAGGGITIPRHWPGNDNGTYRGALPPRK